MQWCLPLYDHSVASTVHTVNDIAAVIEVAAFAFRVWKIVGQEGSVAG